MKIIKTKRLLAALSLLILSACISSDGHSVRARPEVPESAAVAELIVPYEAGYPFYAVFVKRIAFKKGIKEEFERIGALTRHKASVRFTETKKAEILARKMQSALSGIGNIKLFTPSALRDIGSGRYKADLAEGVLGPFVVEAVVTELQSKVEEKISGYNLLVFGRNKTKIVKGTVGLDVTLHDGRNSEIVTSIPVTASYTSQQEEASANLVLPIVEQKALVRSVMDNAIRVALNQAAEKIYSALKNNIEKQINSDLVVY